MSNGKHYCPICNQELETNSRYPNYICPDCVKTATDENGRALSFYNEGVSGGFKAVYKETETERESHICFISGAECYADEARMGGIVVQPIE